MTALTAAAAANGGHPTGRPSIARIVLRILTMTYVPGYPPNAVVACHGRGQRRHCPPKFPASWRKLCFALGPESAPLVSPREQGALLSPGCPSHHLLTICTGLAWVAWARGQRPPYSDPLREHVPRALRSSMKRAGSSDCPRQRGGEWRVHRNNTRTILTTDTAATGTVVSSGKMGGWIPARTWLRSAAWDWRRLGP